MASKPYATSYARDIALLGSPGRRFWFAAVAVALLAGPLVLSELHVVVASTLFITLIGAVAINLLMGVAGVLSLGAAAFLAVGSFAATFFAVDLELPFALVLLGSGLTAALVGAVVALFTARLRGLYVVMATFALHFIAIFAVAQYQVARVGSAGWMMPRVEIGPWSSRSDSFWYFMALVLAGVTVLVAANIMRSGVGRSWIAMRDRDIVAEAIGINLFRAKVVAFAGTSFLFGVAGALNSYFIGHVGSEQFTIALAIEYLAIIIIGGIGSILGSVIGTMFVVLLPYVVEWFIEGGVGISFESALGGQQFEVQAAIYGVAIIAFMLIEPGGIAALWQRRIKGYFALWPFRRRWDFGQ
ncbi:branched-chain amino acid ABC transporter permease [Pseudonocardia nigra]|uniref:branched-chain amino acid ABC transporter permease n=1 Tax=Pseudonocardia nigra TaxID=1921578 RepID=UPI001C5EC9C2|nr:branched-chain amino acid ABC transporter permease [Pseudonocardia nigra]